MKTFKDLEEKTQNKTWKKEAEEEIKQFIQKNHLDIGWKIADKPGQSLSSNFCYAFRSLIGVKQWRQYWRNGDIKFID